MDEHHPFEQFDEPARNILRFAEVEARLFQQDAIGTEHLLLGIMHHPPTRAATTAFYFPFLDPLGANLDDVRATTEQGKGTTVGRVGFTSEAQQALDEAREEAGRSNRGYVGVKQLLFGLLAVPQSHAQHVLMSMGIDLDQVHEWMRPLPPFPSTPVEVTRFGRLTEQARQTVSLSQEEARRLYAVPGEITLTPRARKVLLRAVDEAELLGHTAGEAGHLLLSLVREDLGIAAGIFEHLGVSRGDIRTETLRRLASRTF